VIVGFPFIYNGNPHSTPEIDDVRFKAGEEVIGVRHTPHGYWLEEAGWQDPLPPLEEELRADAVVIGGGYTGLWAAWWISEHAPDARVVVLEADVCGAGPSGRNGGFVNSMWFSLPAMRMRFGDAAALAVARAARDSVAAIGTWCDEQSADAWYRSGGYLQVSTAPAHDAAWAPIAAACAELGEPDACHPLSGAETRARCDSPLFRSGALYPVGATIQPARLARELRERLLARGVAIHERSRVRALDASPSGVRAQTAGGSVRAPAAVLAIGPSLPGVRPLERRLTLTSSHMAITEPVPDVLEEIGWTGGECISDSRATVRYLRTTPDGRIAFGWGGGRVVWGARVGGRAQLDGDIVREVAADMVRFFPQLSGRRLTHAWGGPIDVSPTHLPVLGSLGGDRVHYAFGYTGNGVGPSHLAGRILASLALDRRDEPTRLALVEPPPVKVPPEPLRYLGGALVRAALVRRERLEEEGRRPGRLTRFLAGVPERVGIQVGR
jgi:glycine/D-amino acid oxidase-like deaminating enzyme